MAQEDKRLKRRVRSSYFISTVSIAMVLFLLGATTYLILNALNATERLRESVVIHVMLDGGLSDEQKAEVGRNIESHEAVRQVTYVSKEAAAEKFIAESGENFTAFLGDDPEANPLPDSFEAALAAEGSEKEIIEALVTALEATPGVDEVVYQKGVIEQIGTNLGKFNLVLLLFGGALLLISLILLNNTIRMTILAKRRIISTMRLVGANNGFIIKPFVMSAVVHGLYAGVAAAVLFALLVFGLQEGIPEINFLKENVLLGAIAGGMVALGVILSMAFTLFSVNRAVRQESAKALI